MHGTMKLQSLVWYMFNLEAPPMSPGRSTISYIGLNKISDFVGYTIFTATIFGKAKN